MARLGLVQGHQDGGQVSLVAGYIETRPDSSLLPTELEQSHLHRPAQPRSPFAVAKPGTDSRLLYCHVNRCGSRGWSCRQGEPLHEQVF